MASSSKNQSHAPPLHGPASSDHFLHEPVGAGCGHLSDDRRKTCLCSPTTHPGSFRCSLHRSSTSLLIKPRQSANANSPARIGSANGEWIKRILTTLISPSPSSLRKRRCEAFRPRPSRLSVMSKADDL